MVVQAEAEEEVLLAATLAGTFASSAGPCGTLSAPLSATTVPATPASVDAVHVLRGERCITSDVPELTTTPAAGAFKKADPQGPPFKSVSVTAKGCGRGGGGGGGGEGEGW